MSFGGMTATQAMELQQKRGGRVIVVRVSDGELAHANHYDSTDRPPSLERQKMMSMEEAKKMQELYVEQAKTPSRKTLREVTEEPFVLLKRGDIVVPVWGLLEGLYEIVLKPKLKGKVLYYTIEDTLGGNRREVLAQWWRLAEADEREAGKRLR